MNSICIQCITQPLTASELYQKSVAAIQYSFLPIFVAILLAWFKTDSLIVSIAMVVVQTLSTQVFNKAKPASINSKERFSKAFVEKKFTRIKSYSAQSSERFH